MGAAPWAGLAAWHLVERCALPGRACLACSCRVALSAGLGLGLYGLLDHRAGVPEAQQLSNRSGNGSSRRS